MANNPERVESIGVNGDATLSGLEIFLDVNPGWPLRVNPGLNDLIPLGLTVGKLIFRWRVR
jgi:hypothetical protein